MSKTFRKSPKTRVKYQDKDRRKGKLKTNRSCLHGGSCEWCRGDREYHKIKTDLHSKIEIEEYVGKF